MLSILLMPGSYALAFHTVNVWKAGLVSGEYGRDLTGITEIHKHKTLLFII